MEQQSEDKLNFEVFGNVIQENYQIEDKNSLDIFDFYTHLLKGKIYRRHSDFSTRLEKGYNALLNNLKRLGN